MKTPRDLANEIVNLLGGNGLSTLQQTELVVELLRAEQRPRSKSVLQDWVMDLPIRLQGVLVTAIRGYDGWVKHSEPKRFIRELRGLVLNPADARELAFARGFMCQLLPDSSTAGFQSFLDEFDSLNVHYVLHLMHAIEIVGYEHPNHEARDLYQLRYLRLVRKMHLYPESHEQMLTRLTEDRVAAKSVESQ